MESISIYFQIAITFVILAWIFDTLVDKCDKHSHKFRLTQKYKFFRPNWENRYVMDTGRIIKVKWWAWIVPMFIDGPHFFAFWKRFAWLNACYFFGGHLLPGNYFTFLFALWIIRRIEHFAIMHGGKK